MSVTRKEPARASSVLPPRHLLILAAITLGVGVALRFVTRSDLWLDEALSVNISALPLGDIPEALRHDGHPPLYYVLLHGWMSLVGESDAAVRAFSGLLSVACLPLVWFAARRRGSAELAWVATILLAGSPFAIRYGTETRMYSLVMVLVLVGFLVLDDVLRRPTALRLAALVAVSGALLLTHYWAIWLLGATIGLLVLRGWRDPETRGTSMRGAAAIAGGGVLFLPWLPVFLDQAAHTGTPWAGAVRPTSFLAVTVSDFGGGGLAVRDVETAGWILAVLMVLGVFGRAVDSRHIELDLRTNPQFRREVAVVVVTIALGLGASWLTDSAWATRYASVFFPLLVLVVAGGVMRFTGAGLRTGVLACTIVLMLGVAAYGSTVNRTQAGEIAAGIEDPLESLVVSCPDQLAVAVDRQLPEGTEHVTYPDLTGPARVDWRDYGDRFAAADPEEFARAIVERAGDRTIWYVSSPSYRLIEDQCDRVRDAVGQFRIPRITVAENGEKYFEHASLTVFPPP